MCFVFEKRNFVFVRFNDFFAHGPLNVKNTFQGRIKHESVNAMIFSDWLILLSLFFFSTLLLLTGGGLLWLTLTTPPPDTVVIDDD